MSISIQVSEDAYKGNAQFAVKVDGKQIGGTETATTPDSSGQWQTITLNDVLAPGSHSVSVTFLNDAYGGSSSLDRNLYVKSISAGGVTATENRELETTGSSVAAQFKIPSASAAEERSQIKWRRHPGFNFLGSIFLGLNTVIR